MELWNDYEGRIIAEAYPLQKLLSPEGRSASFSTSNGTGTPSVIRLIEPHFDEAEILSRWRQVQDLHQPNLITLRKCGETELDGASLVYAVMEPTDSSLADILRERPLTVDETRQVAASLTSALLALHARNLVHEHITPSNIFATGEVVKLRSDCVREAPEGQPGIDLKTRDVHDLAVVLLRCLTLQPNIPTIPLPVFNDAIRNGIAGTWSLAQIAAAVTPPATAKPRPSPPKPSPAESSTPRPAPSVVKPPAAASPQFVPAPPIAPDVRHRLVTSVEPLPLRFNLKLAAGLAVAFVLVVFFLWHNLHTSAPSASNPPETTLATEQYPAPTPAPTQVDSTSPARALAAISQSAPAPAADTRSQWRVVAYTYNHQDQAQKKVDTITAKHAELRPEVFTPTGRAPYLVVLGGPLPRDQAFALRNKARSTGLPGDTYAQNYSR